MPGTSTMTAVSTTRLTSSGHTQVLTSTISRVATTAEMASVAGARRGRRLVANTTMPVSRPTMQATTMSAHEVRMIAANPAADSP